MSNALQNRLVGTIILVAVTVIFLPDYLDGKKQTNNETFVDFPRSTSNLSATEPETFPAEEVADATRREVEILDEEASDDLLEKANDDLADNTQNTPGSEQTDDSSKDEANELAKILDKNMQAAAGESSSEQNTTQPDNTELQAEESKPATSSQDNSLAKQTLQKDTTADKLKDAGWVVQLGSFGNQKNVNDLMRKLEKAGYRAFSRKVQTSAGRLTKVFVGPEIEREKLEKALPHLKETTGLTGKVTTFDVGAN